MAKEATTEVKDKDFLDEFKAVERAIRAKALAKMLSRLKEKAHEILELKEYTNVVLEELGVEEADCKRLINWINSLEQVKLSKKDKGEICDDARDDVKEERKVAEKKVDTAAVFVGYSQLSSTPTYTTATGTGWSGSTSSSIKGSIGAMNSVSSGSDNMGFELTAGSSTLDIHLK